MENKKYLGLAEKEALEKQKENGLNQIEEKKPGIFRKFLAWFLSPIALMLLGAAILSLAVSKTFDFYFIIVLMLINFLVGFWQEKKADDAISKLSQKLSVEVKVLRDEKWRTLDAKFLVVGDVIELDFGDMIPADVKILEAKNLSVNESSLTGESLSKEKQSGDECFSGSFVAQGWARAEVAAIGKNTYFGKILFSIDKSYERSLLEKDILSISKLLSGASLAAVIILTVFFVFKNEPFLEILTLDLSLFIAGIPISLPTIMTLIISFGVLDLAKKKTIVRRLSALEDLANVNLLLSDKTGTLTKNKIVVEKVIAYDNFSENDALTFAFFTTQENDRNPINVAVRKKVEELKLETVHKINDFSPFDSSRKRSSAKVIYQNKNLSIRSGAAQVIETFCDLDDETRGRFEKDIQEAAQKGYRTVAVSVKDYASGKEKMALCGLLLFSDTLDKGVKQTIKFIQKNGIKIKMVTGDNISIAKRIFEELNLGGKVVNKEKYPEGFENLTGDEFKNIGAFAEILPADKYQLVKIAKRDYVVAVTGDGINDLPALKEANVSIAVKNAVDALKSAADINLMKSGISVIKDAIIESRKIFARLYAYSVYRISESFRVIVTIVMLGIVYGVYPLSAMQLIILALLNDIPIISLAFNRVKVAAEPSKIDVKSRLFISLLFGMVGTVNSFLFVILLRNFVGLDWGIIQTLFFLKLTVSGHLLVFVAHTSERWYKYLPSKQVIWAILLTQLTATLFAVLGFFMNKVSLPMVIFVWIWAIFWMQVSEWMKDLKNFLGRNA